MPKTLSRTIFQRLLNAPRTRDILEDLHACSGTEAMLLDAFGNERLRFPRNEALPFRQQINEVPELRQEHQRVRQALLSGSESPEQLPWQELILPLTLEGERMAYLMLSPFRRSGEPEALRRFWIQAVRQGLSLSWAEWLQAWQSLPAWSSAQQKSWIHLMEAFWQQLRQSLDQSPQQHLPAERLPPLILQACREVQERFAEPLRQQDLAEELGVSAEHMSRLFHQSTGLRFGEYLCETRIHAVKEELKHTRDPISRISERCGFSSLSRFNESFRRITGTNPSRWRKLHHDL